MIPWASYDSPMPWLTILIVMALILILGSGLALYWWNIAAKMSPYKDELEKQRARDDAARREEANVVVIHDADKRGPNR
jgi:hypothetical protein